MGAHDEQDKHTSAPSESPLSSCSPSLPLVLFVCDSNSARSVACEHIARQKYGEGFAFSSAGLTSKYERPKANVVDALKRQCGIDASQASCRLLSVVLRSASPGLIVMLCCEPDALCERVPSSELPASVRVVSLPLPGPKDVGDDDTFIQIVQRAIEQDLPAFLKSVSSQRDPHAC